ncbi:MAG: carbohydrate ABC transporter permease [Promethearchaeota archaeon]
MKALKKEHWNTNKSILININGIPKTKWIMKSIFARDKFIIRLIFIISCILIIYFVYFFIVWNVIVSLTGWEGLVQTYDFIGLENYSQMSQDYVFWTSLLNNFIFMGIFIPSSIILGLLLAIILDQKVKREGFFRLIYLLPYALSFVVTAYLWQWMFTSDGVLNILIDAIVPGTIEISWLGNRYLALVSISIAMIWQFSGYVMLVFLAGIRSVPPSIIMAARIDGASGFKLYTRIIIPQIKTSAFTAFVILMIFTLKAFDFIYLLTGGGPGYGTYILPIMMYEEAFAKNQFAYSSTIATTLLIVVMMITIPYLYITYRKRDNQK